MQYVSTRGAAPTLDFGDVLLTGLATDGGLYLPERWPTVTTDDLAAWEGRSYQEIAVEVIAPFVAGSLERDELAELVDAAYAGFDHPEVAPLRRLDGNDWLLELFWGPTLAFKDLPLQLVGRLFDRELARRDSRVTVIGATSGDTGSAAIEALRHNERASVFILHPHGRVSETQRRQMTTVDSPNVHNLAIEGTFDDCQDLVKAMFADEELRTRAGLSAVNSINWARVMGQIVYYLVAIVRLTGGRAPVAFSVPTGNFGNILSGWAARTMGAPVSRLVCASNANDILTRLFASGTMEIHDVVPTISPSMDIQVSSNLERLLYELSGRDGEAIATLMTTFRDEGSIRLPDGMLAPLDEMWQAASVDDDRTRAVIAEWVGRAGVTVDPHTAVGLAAAADHRGDPSVPMVTMATAHPAKFADAVAEATGTPPELPPRLARLAEQDEHYEVLPADLAVVRDHVVAHCDP